MRRAGVGTVGGHRRPAHSAPHMARTREARETTHSGAVGAPVSSGLGNGQVPVSVSALTPRQREIAGLLARGLPNADIARQLVLTSGTVANHVASILQRLGLDSRTQVAAWAVEHGLYGGQDRLLTVLEQLLDLEPEQISAGLGLVANLVADALSADKVDMFLVDEAGA